MYSPVTCEDDKFERLEKKLLRAPKKAATYYEESNNSIDEQSSNCSGFQQNDTHIDKDYYCDTTGYQNYLNEIKDVTISNGPFGHAAPQQGTPAPFGLAI